MVKEKDYFAKMINCRTPQEVYARVRTWSSPLSDHEHLVRSTILDIQANVERQLKRILHLHLRRLVFIGEDVAKAAKCQDSLLKHVERMSYTRVYHLLQPCLESFPQPELHDDTLRSINDVRNSAIHGEPANTTYKRRNPFANHDCLAQLFFDSWTVIEGLKKFLERQIEDQTYIENLGRRAYLGKPVVGENGKLISDETSPELQRRET